MNHFQAVRKSLKMLAAFLIGLSGDLYPASGKNRTVEGQRSPPKTKRPGLSTRPLKNATILNQLKRELARLLLRRPRRFLLLDRPLQLERARRQLGRFRLQQKRVEAAAVIDALDRVGRNPQAHVAAERIGHEGDVAQVRQEPALGLDVGVADLVAHLRALGRQFTAPRHLQKSSSIPGTSDKRLSAARGFKITSIEGAADV